MKATVLMRRKANSQNMQSNSTDAIATPPSSVASPSRPIAVVETMPISGVVRFAIIAGPAMANTCRRIRLTHAWMPTRRVDEPQPMDAVRRCLAGVYRPRGAPNSRDNSQIGITITAPSRK